MRPVPLLIPITDFRQDAARALEQVKNSQEPVFITQRGRATAVMLSVEAYQHAERERELLMLLAMGEQEIAVGEGRTLTAVLNDAERLLRAAGV